MPVFGNGRGPSGVILTGDAWSGGTVTKVRETCLTVATLAVVAAMTSGCATGVAQEAQQPPSSPSSSATPIPKHVLHGTGHLRMMIVPTSGPAGTEVSITATGCGDASGDSHSVSFNPGFGNTVQAAQAHYRVGAIPSHLTDQDLAASYRITVADARAAALADDPPPLFYVQCRDDIAEAPFSITR